MRYELTDDEWAAILPATLMGSANSSGRGGFARGLYVENNLPFRRWQAAFQHHVRIARIREREDCTYAGFQLAAVNELGERAQPLGRHFHQEEGCCDPVVLCALLIRLGHGGNQLAARAKNLERTHLRLASDEIEDRVDIPHLILEALGVIIQYLVGTEGAHILDIPGTRRRD